MALAQLRSETFMDSYKPSSKQLAFHANMAPERCLMAGNQLGKTLAGSMEFAYHATGLYPDWWEGRRFKKANSGWISGVTSEVVRDSVQLLMCGSLEKDELGQGAIPARCIEGYTRSTGITNAIDTVRVKHVTGGISLIKFKSYTSRRETFQAATLDWEWNDEEPPIDVYSEGLTRMNNGQLGHVKALTYTPILGMSEVTHMFLNEPHASQSVINMTLWEVDHYSDEQKQQIVDAYLPHEKEARELGIPTIGTGRVFPISESTISESHIEIPPFWPQINGLDFGWDHPQACVNLALDRDTDVIHVTKIFREKECLPALAALTIRKWGEWIPCSWPHDGYQHDKGSGLQLAEQYREAGLEMLEAHATHEEGGFGVEAGILDMLERMKSGRFKVDENLTEWWDEFRMYHRDKGKIVKERDDLMAATRYAVMMLRYADTEPQDYEEEYSFEEGRSSVTGY